MAKKCFTCNLALGDYNVDYMCYLIGKGKFNNKYICTNCLYNRIIGIKEKKNSYQLKLDYNYKDEFKKLR